MDRNEQIASLRAQARESAKLKRTLQSLSDSVLCFLSLLDEEKKKSSSFQRGLRIGDLAARLEYANDTVRLFTLKLPIDKPSKQKQIDKIKRKTGKK